jgi:hypothetical protein
MVPRERIEISSFLTYSHLYICFSIVYCNWQAQIMRQMMRHFVVHFAPHRTQEKCPYADSEGRLLNNYDDGDVDKDDIKHLSPARLA